MAVEDYNELEQEERVKRWLKEYGTAIVLGIVLAIGGIFGFRQWQVYQSTQQQVASEHYTLIREALEDDRFEDAWAEYETLRDDYAGQGYTALSALRIGSALVEQERIDEAMSAYRLILEQRGNETLKPVARLRLARLLLAEGRPDEALELVPGPAPAGFEAAYAEVRGDIHIARDDVAAARTAYQEALDQLPANGGNPRFLQIKLDSLGDMPDGEDETAEQSS